MTETTALIGKYKIVEEIGHGGFATVYKAVDTTLDREVALKVLDPLLTRDPAQEKTLLSLDQIASIVQQIGAALDYAHAHGAIHRDVKPSNIIVDPSGHATLTDFGIVKALEATTIQTTSGAILGTPSYSSPEQAESRPLDGRSDLYSLGIVAYELCTGKVPFVADTTPSLYYKIVHEEPPSPPQVHARVAGLIEPVLLKAIAKQLDQRYQTGQEFGAALAAAVERVKGELTQSLYEQARALFAQEKLDEAEANLSQMLAIQPNHKGAQALLEQIGQRRESQQRYQELAGVVKQARAQAADLKQAYPDMADPNGLYRLLEDPGSQASRPAAQPAPTPARWAVSRVQLIVTLVLLIGAIVIVLTGAQAGGVWVVVNSPEQTGLLYRLIVGNLVLGIGLGAGISGLLLLGFSIRKSQ